MASSSSSDWSASAVSRPYGVFHNASLFLQLLLLERENLAYGINVSLK